MRCGIQRAAISATPSRDNCDTRAARTRHAANRRPMGRRPIEPGAADFPRGVGLAKGLRASSPGLAEGLRASSRSIFESCSVTRAISSSALAIRSWTRASCSSARAIKTSFVFGVEFIGVSLSVQCHPRSGSNVWQVDRQPKTLMPSCRGRMIESIGPHHLTRQVRRCGQRNEASMNCCSTAMASRTRHRFKSPRI